MLIFLLHREGSNGEFAMTSGSVRITILVDDQAGDGLIAEHGLSLWIEAGDRRILFDTGQGVALEANARKLGVDLSQTDILVLSHGHYDHTGGVARVLAAAPQAEVFFHPAALQSRYSIHDGVPKPVHMPTGAMDAIGRLPYIQRHWLLDPVILLNGVGITGPVPRKTDFEDTGGPFYLDTEARRADFLEDDMSLWVKTPNGLIVCTGCCHSGLVNTLVFVLRISGAHRLCAVIGGFHLVHANNRRIERTTAVLRSLAPDKVVPCHCTGKPVIRMLKEVLGIRLICCRSGMQFTFE